ncbi:MAG: hypothetical protein ACRDFB_09030 [Rhabdochlamydiaceae bacterium]
MTLNRTQLFNKLVSMSSVEEVKIDGDREVVINKYNGTFWIRVPNTVEYHYSNSVENAINLAIRMSHEL